MNLHAIAGPIVAAVNPPVLGVIRVSAGYTTDAAGVRTPTYSDTSGVSMQVQALSGPELAQVDALNIEGSKRGVYLFGDIKGVNRPAAKGGDLLIFSGRTWLVVQQLEAWGAGDWCKVAVAEQIP